MFSIGINHLICQVTGFEFQMTIQSSLPQLDCTIPAAGDQERKRTNIIFVGLVQFNHRHVQNCVSVADISALKCSSQVLCSLAYLLLLVSFR